ncbi:hypothetical protein QOZ80_4AG0327410 [Eleusine coracana subsp. coracana]|nr:hypothetical protein QOZ80_4AG0327410 [Eleusine coracana subsp. coracana]
MEEETKAIAALPDDALAGVLCVLPPRSLGVAQCVCKAWRDIIDDRALLLPHLHLLPRSVRGVFINYTGHYRPHLFSRPCSSSSTFPRIDGLLSFMIDDNEDEWWLVIDHCNGLLICHLDSGVYVCNPATQRWTLLPACATPSSSGPYYEGPYLAFDPAMSPHYEVFRIPR